MRFLEKLFLLLVLLSIVTQQVVPFAIAQESRDVDVSATVPATPPDIHAQLTVNTEDTKIDHDTELTYTLQYGSNLPYPTNLELQIEWNNDIISGNTVLYRYVTGSASKGYNDAPPIIDLVNKRITWTIPSFPAETTDKTVTFKIKTTSEYQGSNGIDFSVIGRTLGPGTSTPDRKVTKTYLYNSRPQPTSIPQTGTPTPSPTPLQQSFFIQSVDLHQVSTSSATIHTVLTEPGEVTIRYGKRHTSMTNSLTSLQQTRRHTIALNELDKNTPYYFQIIARGPNGSTRTSDIYTFTTAAHTQTTLFNPQTLIVASNNVFLFSGINAQGDTELPTLLLPTNHSFSTQFAIHTPEKIKHAEIFIQNNDVLGFSTLLPVAQASTERSSMMQVRPGEFVGHLQTKATGNHTLLVRIADTDGNISEHEVALLTVVSPLIITDDSNNPIENAKVTLSLYNPTTRIFEVISPSSLPIQNPLITDHTGIVRVVLPQATYRANISALGYKEEQVDFTLGTNPNEGYPKIQLKKEPFNLLTFALKTINTGKDTFKLLQQTLQSIQHSPRFSNFAASIVVLCFVLLTFLAFSARTHIPLLHIPYYLTHLLTHKEAKKTHSLQATIKDQQTKKPLSHARVFLLSNKTKTIINQTKTDKDGTFSFIVPSNQDYTLEIMKLGYITLQIPGDTALMTEPILLSQHVHTPLKERFIHMVGVIMSFGFEVFLVLSLLLESLLVVTIGFAAVLPFFLLSLMNLFLWVLFLSQRRKAFIALL